MRRAAAACHRVDWIQVIVTLCLLAWAGGCAKPASRGVGSGLGHLIEDPPARAGSGWVHAVVEIPAGTNAKWEVEKKSGQLQWEQRDGRPRVVNYLPYPANYGMVPRTLSALDEGGDGDPLDVVVLGPALQRGQLARVRLIGVLRMLDDGETDDKLLAVAHGSPFSQVDDLAELQREYPGATTILETWFRNYKGPGVVEILGVQPETSAREIFEAAVAAYERR